MKIPEQVVKSPRSEDRRRQGHLWAVLLPLYVLTTAALDPSEVTNHEYLQFVVATRHPAPEHWVNGRYAAGRDNEPVVLVTWHDAVAYCRWVGRRLPTVEEWMSTCKTGKLKKGGDIWEWTSTEVEMERQPFKALCGPGNSCDCSHRYHPDWKNEVKGFRCARDALPLTWLPLLSGQEIFS
ncbi:MAG: SUMF1/EgtB/PvdO family nonheme iron enzyme [Deltaproteobacteria bacterium]|nr:SUMF1/EgtB/PvdO family nonheme iron enzyme [Deltaproteobacteria bacterium]